MKQNVDLAFEKKYKSSNRHYLQTQGNLRAYQKSETYQRQVGFECLHCKQNVASQALYSGVNNRNHCPYCLFSRHVDLFKAGDRLCACRESMQPLGLTFKKERKKYGSPLGELMLIHQCTACKAISINRVAADDSNERLLGVLMAGQDLPEHIRRHLAESGILVAGIDQLDLVKMRLFGAADSLC